MYDVSNYTIQAIFSNTSPALRTCIHGDFLRNAGVETQHSTPERTNVHKKVGLRRLALAQEKKDIWLALTAFHFC